MFFLKGLVDPFSFSQMRIVLLLFTCFLSVCSLNLARVQFVDIVFGANRCWNAQLMDIGMVMQTKMSVHYDIMSGPETMDLRDITVKLRAFCDAERVQQLEIKRVVVEDGYGYGAIENIHEITLIAAIDTLTEFSENENSCIRVMPRSGNSQDGSADAAYIWSRLGFEFVDERSRLQFKSNLIKALWTFQMDYVASHMIFWDMSLMPRFDDPKYVGLVSNINSPDDVLNVPWSSLGYSSSLGERYLRSRGGQWKGKLCPYVPGSLSKLEDLINAHFTNAAHKLA